MNYFAYNSLTMMDYFAQLDVEAPLHNRGLSCGNTNHGRAFY